MFQKKMFNHIMCSIWIVPFSTALVGCLFALLIWQLNGDYQAFIETYFIHFNGFFVGGSAYMLLVFIWTFKNSVVSDMNSLFGSYCIDNTSYCKALAYSQNRKIALVFLCTITAAGGSSLYINGYPLRGLGKVVIIISTFSIYSIAGYALWSFVSIYKIISALDGCELRESIIGDQRIEKLISYINISSGLALAALFIAYNGTLTANFTYGLYGECTKYVLLFPIILFIPVLLYYNYYPNIMLKKMYKSSTMLEIAELKNSFLQRYSDPKDNLTLEQIVHSHEIYLNEKLDKLTLPAFENIAVMATAIYMGVNLFISISKLHGPN